MLSGDSSWKSRAKHSITYFFENSQDLNTWLVTQYECDMIDKHSAEQRNSKIGSWSNRKTSSVRNCLSAETTELGGGGGGRAAMALQYFQNYQIQQIFKSALEPLSLDFVGVQQLATKIFAP